MLHQKSLLQECKRDFFIPLLYQTVCFKLRGQFFWWLVICAELRYNVSMEQTEAKKKKTFRTVELAYIALGAALITVCAWITIPFTVPFTMQIFAVFLSLILIGGRDGTIAVLVYLLLGAIGVPVFSGGKGGFAVLIGLTGGYLWGMILIGIVYWIAEKLFGDKLWSEIGSLAIGLVLCYLFGTVWFTVLNADRGFFASLLVCVVPFIVPDMAKLSLALLLGRRLRKRITRS